MTLRFAPHFCTAIVSSPCTRAPLRRPTHVKKTHGVVVVVGKDSSPPTKKDGLPEPAWRGCFSFARLVEAGRAGPHAALIGRDVPRAFGAVAPHKRRGPASPRAVLATTATASSAAGGGDRGLVMTLQNLLGGWWQELQGHDHQLSRDQPRQRISLATEAMDAAWEAVPVAAKRECLGNVLLAVAARFPDVGYCQVGSFFACQVLGSLGVVCKSELCFVSNLGHIRKEEGIIPTRRVWGVGGGFRSWEYSDGERDSSPVLCIKLHITAQSSPVMSYALLDFDWWMCLCVFVCS